MAQISGHNRKFSLPLLLSSLVLSGIGFLAFFSYGESASIRCAQAENRQVDCSKQTSWLNRWVVARDEVLPHVTRARVEVSCSTDTNDSYECLNNVLVIENEQKSLAVGSPDFNEDSAAAARERINEYIRQPGEPAIVIPGGNILYTILGFSFVAAPFISLGGILLWAGGPWSDRPTGWARLKRHEPEK